LKCIRHIFGKLGWRCRRKKRKRKNKAAREAAALTDRACPSKRKAKEGTCHRRTQILLAA
jgi:hypothetical protein